MYNMRVIDYGDSVQVRLYNRPVSGRNDNVSRETIDTDLSVDELESRHQHSVFTSMNRTKNSIYCIARANNWKYFITLTFDRKITDSSDYSLISKRSRQWCNNLKKRFYSDLNYLLIPELHSDGEHWHIHGLLGNCDDLPVSDSGIVKSGRKIYNISGWHYGFSTATIIDDSVRVASYITKYITKSLVDATPNRQRYWASRNCNRLNDIVSDYMIDNQAEFFQQYGTSIDYVSSVRASCGLHVKYVEISR